MVKAAPASSPPDPTAAPLLVIVGPTASGKSTLALHLALQLGGEIVSCDSVAVYRGLEIGAAKPLPANRAQVPHHGLDLRDPDEPCTAGDYARATRLALAAIRDRGRLPIVAGGTGLYLRALLEGLAPAPPRDPALRDRLRAFADRRGPGALHRLLCRVDPVAARAIHPNDTPKLIRSLEVAQGGRMPQSQQWLAGRDPLQGFKILQIGLDPPRADLYARIDQRAAGMFRDGLLQETAALEARFGKTAHALGSLGYAQARAVLAGRQSLPAAVAETQQGHRNYSKRQLTWFRRDRGTHWIAGFGDHPWTERQALLLIREHLIPGPARAERESAA